MTTRGKDGLSSVSSKRARVYRRAFDHEKAREMRAAGQTYGAIARTFGVSPTAIARVCDPDFRARMDARTKDFLHKRRVPCRGGCGALTWLHMNEGRTGYCEACVVKLRTASDERPEELRCRKCDTWKPDEAFRAESRPTRRGRSSQCRECENATRRAYRVTHPDAEKINQNRQKRQKRKEEGRMERKWVVLQKDDDGRWSERGRTGGTNRLHAVEQIADAEGIWIAVSEAQMVEHPVRSQQAFKVQG